MYENSSNELASRILKLIPDNPSILELEDAWGLFSIPGFKCSDLAPSLFQAQWALDTAKQLYHGGR